MYLSRWKRCDSPPNGSILDAGRRGMETEGAGGVDAGPVSFQAAGPWTQHRFRGNKPGLRPQNHCTQLQGSGPPPCPMQGAVSRLPCSIAVSVQ